MQSYESTDLGVPRGLGYAVRSQRLGPPGNHSRNNANGGGSEPIVTLPNTSDGRRVRSRVEAGELTAFSAAFQMVEQEWPAKDRRIVRRASLVGLALVDRPEHETTLIDRIRIRPETR